MTPLSFEQRYGGDWNELEQLLKVAFGQSAWQSQKVERDQLGARLAHLYRCSCEHLAIARARAYPSYLTERLDDLTQRAHQLIYRQRSWGLDALRTLLLIGIPQQVRAHAQHVWLALAAFGGPLLAMGLLTYFDPTLILSLLDAYTVQNFTEMYGAGADSIGRTRHADTDWQMFGFYIMNNIGIAFQCFASGLFLGLGSLFFLSFNGALIGAVAGYLTERGLADNFYAFVVTHSAFELPAIVLSGAAGLQLGHALLAPGRRTRIHALREAAREAIVIVYGVTAMLLIAAALEAFWSSSRWVPPTVKYSVGAVCWVLVAGYLLWQGRPQRHARAR